MDYRTTKQLAPHFANVAEAVNTRSLVQVEEALEGLFESFSDSFLSTVDEVEGSLHTAVSSALELELEDVRDEVDTLLVNEDGEDTLDSLWWCGFANSCHFDDLADRIAIDLTDSLKEYFSAADPYSYYGVSRSDF